MKIALKIAIVMFVAIFTCGLALAVPVDVVVLDAGHGGYDTGMRPPGMKEKDFTLAVVKKLKDKLQRMGKEVYLSRKIDQYSTLDERRKEANLHGPELFISIHMSSGSNFAVYVTWYRKSDTDLSLREYYALSSRQRRYLYDSNAFARSVEASIKETFKDIEVIHREMSLVLLDTIGAPAILVECPSVGMDYSSKDLNMVVDALLKGISSYERR